MSGKRYGKGAKAAQRLDEELPFELEVLRNDDEEVHEFTAVNKADTILGARFMTMDEADAGRMLRTVTKLIAKTLDNKDGVPVQWSPIAVPKPKNAGKNYEPKFRGPDGQLHPMDQAAKFQDFAAGSSRRRWEALLADEDATCELEALGAITKDLISASTGTLRKGRSSRSYDPPPLYGPWIRGQMAMAGADTRMPIDAWLDAIHATLAAAPHDVLSKLNDQFIINAVLADPEGARRPGGALPEHQLKTPAEAKFRNAEQ